MLSPATVAKEAAADEIFDIDNWVSAVESMVVRLTGDSLENRLNVAIGHPHITAVETYFSIF